METASGVKEGARPKPGPALIERVCECGCERRFKVMETSLQAFASRLCETGGRHEYRTFNPHYNPASRALYEDRGGKYLVRKS